uniref:Regulator of G-protein signaling 7 n=1 Tax=Timema poppense TaxID=170557 RepID=A0A7R9DJF0_TIMPO|nr:unnamed protein product [Timema poppensis]
MEGLVREMQDHETGVPVRSQKLFLTSIPSAFMGYDLIEWLMERLNIEESGTMEERQRRILSRVHCVNRVPTPRISGTSLYEHNGIQRLSLLMMESFKVEKLFADLNTKLGRRWSHDTQVEPLPGQIWVTVGSAYQRPYRRLQGFSVISNQRDEIGVYVGMRLRSVVSYNGEQAVFCQVPEVIVPIWRMAERAWRWPVHGAPKISFSPQKSSQSNRRVYNGRVHSEYIHLGPARTSKDKHSNGVGDTTALARATRASRQVTCTEAVIPVEALHIANQLCQYGYFFPVSDSKNLLVKDDSSLYRFQTPYYWPWQHRHPDNVDYAIYLSKRTLRNKQRHGLEEYELEALNSLKKNLQNKWDFITMQAEEQVRLAKERKKGEKIVSDSQERAYWRVYRPPPGYLNYIEPAPVPNRSRGARCKKRSLEDLNRQVDFLRSCLVRTRVKVSQALDNLLEHCETYIEYDPFLTGLQPSSPWISEDPIYWQLNSPLVDVPTEKRVKRWALSMEELVSDPTGLQEFTAYLRKEYSHENIRFWLAVNDLRRSAQSHIQRKVKDIFDEFLAPGAPCEINIDGKTMERVHQELRTPSRFTFDSAAEHVYALLLKKDCYPRFIRSEHYKGLLTAGVQPLQKKRGRNGGYIIVTIITTFTVHCKPDKVTRLVFTDVAVEPHLCKEFFGFGGQAKKKPSTTTPPIPSGLSQVAGGGMAGRRRGSDISLSGSVHELLVSGGRDTSSRVTHSHSQSNLSDIPYRRSRVLLQPKRAPPPPPARIATTTIPEYIRHDKRRHDIPNCISDVSAAFNA